ncbi:hypothetical protein FKM82_020666 [Ascaphus truei]
MFLFLCLFCRSGWGMGRMKMRMAFIVAAAHGKKSVTQAPDLDAEEGAPIDCNHRRRLSGGSALF